MSTFQVRFAAMSALRRSLAIFVTTAIMVLLVSLIHRIFDGTWYVDWRVMLEVSGVLTLTFFAFCFVTELLELAAEGARERELRLVFPGVMWIRGAYLAAIVMGTVLMVGTYREGAPWWDSAFPFLFVILGFLAWPRAIEISENEIRQRRMLFGLRRIPLTQIQSIVCDPTRNEVVVFAESGPRIVHTMMHVERDRFLQNIENFAHKTRQTMGDLR